MESDFFFKIVTKVKLLERNNRMTDCLFQIIGSTVKQAVGYDKNIPSRVSNFSNSLDRERVSFQGMGVAQKWGCIPHTFLYEEKKGHLNTSKEGKLARMQARGLEARWRVCLTLDTARWLGGRERWDGDFAPARRWRWRVVAKEINSRDGAILSILQLNGGSGLRFLGDVYASHGTTIDSKSMPRILARVQGQVLMEVMVSFPLIRAGCKSRLLGGKGGCGLQQGLSLTPQGVTN